MASLLLFFWVNLLSVLNCGKAVLFWTGLSFEVIKMKGSYKEGRSMAETSKWRIFSLAHQFEALEHVFSKLLGSSGPVRLPITSITTCKMKIDWYKINVGSCCKDCLERFRTPNPRIHEDTVSIMSWDTFYLFLRMQDLEVRCQNQSIYFK